MNPFLSSFLSRQLIDRSHGHRRAVLEAYSEKLRVEALLPEDRTAYLDAKLAGLLHHARIHVPRFRELLGKKAEIVASNASAALASLPIMTRSDIQSDPKAFIAENSESMIDDATGGSSGTPMRFKIDRATQIARESSLYWSDSLAGWRYGERIAMLWGSDKDVKTASQELRSRLRWWIDNRRWYNAFNMGEDRMEAFHREMTRFRPHIIVAYAGSLDVYARFLKEKVSGEEGQPSTFNYPLKAIVSSAEMLMPSTRALVERVFGRPVYDRYGNREFGAIGTEDGKGGLLINPTDMVLEVSTSDAASSGELLVTYLPNLAMPFIRYNTGDLTRFSGTERNRLAPVVGRSSDTIRTASGKLIHGEYFTHLLYRAKKVMEFQFVQESLTRYRLLLVSQGREDEATEAMLRQDILEEVGPDSRLEIQYVESIPVLPSGKRKFTLTHVAD